MTRLSLYPTLTSFLVALLPCLLAAAEEGPAAIDLSGTWAERQIHSEIDTLPIVGRVTSTSTTFLRVTIEQKGTSLLLRETYCSAKVDTRTAIASTVIPPAFLLSLGEIERPASLDLSGPTIQFVSPWFTEVRGARLADPENDPLPTRPDDPRVFDQDGDGKPGLTVRLRVLGIVSGEAYVVQRVRYRMRGTVVTPDRIEGRIEWKNEQITIGATSTLFEANTSGEPNPDPEKSTFVFQRIAPAVGCAGIAEGWNSTLGR
jgi:hypothetical protein